MNATRIPFRYRTPFRLRLVRGIYRLVNLVVPWHRLPGYLAVFNLVAFRERYREENLHDTGYGREAPLPWKPQYRTSRSPDGSYTDLDHPLMGAKGTRFGRNVPLRDLKPEQGPSLLEPSPREVSAELLARDEFKPVTGLNMLAAAWIQFENHDWFFHGKPVTEDPFAVSLIENDDWHEDPMRIPRTPPDPTPPEAGLDGVPTFVNQHPHWWDATQLYGPDERQQMRLRSRTDGKLRICDGGLLPLDPEAEGIDLTGFNDNYWVGLSLLHTLFAREHNAICDALKAIYPGWSDEMLFQTARLVNSALIVKIHTIEWTPAILRHPALKIAMNANWAGIANDLLRNLTDLAFGDKEISFGIPASETHHHSAPYSLTEEFVTVYRLHPLIPDEFTFRDVGDDSVLGAGLSFTEIQGRHTRDAVEQYGMANLFYSFGLAPPGAMVLGNYPNTLRHFEKADEPVIDLAAVDIMRDRERGVPRYNAFRRSLGMKPIRSFRDLTADHALAAKIEKVYRCDIERVDTLVGMLAEAPPEGFGFSDTAFRIFILMASRRIKSDRFLNEDFRTEVYTPIGMDWLEANNMRTVIGRHFPDLQPFVGGVENAFFPWPRRGNPDPA